MPPKKVTCKTKIRSATGVVCGDDSTLASGEFTSTEAEGCGQTTLTTANAKDKPPLKTATIKKEKVDRPPPGEQVFHRKSERRRVARDIFLIFEEQPSSRRRGPRGGGANRKPARPAKPKFGHLKVEEPNTHNNRTKGGLLRDIKNEPKCYLNAAAVVATAALTASAAAASSNGNSNNNNINSNNNNTLNVHSNNNKRGITFKSVAADTNVVGAGLNVTAEPKPQTPMLPQLLPPPRPPAIAAAVLEEVTPLPPSAPAPAPKANSSGDSLSEPIARVNPIFLWVKQDDTRIIEVRCEDYDKRNRIRLTKTTNGWRAIPRTDPTSSRIVKYIQTTPLIKVKREVYETAASREMHERLNDIAFNSLKSVPKAMSPPPPLPQRGDLETVPLLAVPVQTQAADELEFHLNYEEAAETVAPAVAPPTGNQKPRSDRKKKNKKPRVKAKQKPVVGCMETAATAEDLPDAPPPPPQIALVDELPPLLLLVDKTESTDEEQLRMLEEPMEAICNLTSDKELDLPLQLLNFVEKPEEIEVSDAENHAQTYQLNVPTMELQLCPKTGLFLPHNATSAATVAACCMDMDVCASDAISLPSGGGADGCGDMLVRDLVDCDFVCEVVDAVDHKQPSHDDADAEVEEVASTAANIIQNLDAETKNLKDLLDDADFGVGENINSGAELIDSLVKRSCENNLIQEASSNELLKDAFAAVTPTTNHLHHHHDLTRQLELENVAASGLPSHLIDSVSEPPKCLSFNEAGEIEGLNCELFQSTSLAHNFIGTFDVDDVDDKERSSSPLIGVVLNDVDELTHCAEPLPKLLRQEGTDLCVDEREDICRVGEVFDDDNIDDDDDDSDKQPDVRMEDDTPKDLSYKKREEVCPPSESRSQCAVTSSSDVVKSPSSPLRSLRQDEQLPPTTAALESTSETIKNLILEQFIKLNALNGIANVPVPKLQQQQQQQSEPIDLGKHRESTSGTAELDQVVGGGGSGYAASTNFIDTVVVIDDNSDDEPVKKRLRNTLSSSCGGAAILEDKSVAPPPTTAPSIIDKDPDPLTQLQLLLRNTAWKVPDPILVPKDRLGAVLASPAREIPLLITTRPELRLPEAFAYPEIIQNPNILVISMAQLEAILKNEMELEKTNSTTTPLAAKPQQQQQQHRTIACEFPTAATAAAVIAADNNGLRKLNQVQDLQMTCEPLQTEPKISMQQQPKEMSTKCSHVETSNSGGSNSLASDINAATLAVLNQMLWLPYFGQLSQEFMKSLKEPAAGLQNKFAGLLPPPPPPSLFNHHQFGLQHLDELYKTYMKQITNLKHMASPSHHHQQQQPQQVPSYNSAMGAFQNPVELAIFQKILQHQMHNFLNINPLETDSTSSSTAASSTTAAAASQRNSMVKQQQQQHSSNEHSSNLALMNSIDQQKRLKKSLVNQPTLPATCTTEHLNSVGGGTGTNLSVSEKSLCLKRIKSNCDNSLAETSSSMQKQQVATDNKPRLTCKSLSNLLEPENMTSATAAVVPLVNLTSDSIRQNTTTHHESAGSSSISKQMDSKQIPSINKEPNCLSASDSTFRSARTNHSNKMVLNPILNPFDSLSKQRKRNINFIDSGPAAAKAETTTTSSSARSSAAGTVDALNAESNPALWHPLFGSNTKPGYSSPWQWTTVTATGE